MLNKRVSIILNSIEGITLVDFNILLENQDFKENFLKTFDDIKTLCSRFKSKFRKAI